jgi:hypothetical protein
VAQEAKIFKYQTPEFDGVKKSMIVCSSDLMKVMVQVVKNGGENNLHSHTGDDAFWYVLSGAVRFYGEGDKLIGEFSKGEGDFDSARFSVTGSKVQPLSRSKFFASAPKIKPSRTGGSTIPRPNSG